MAFTYTLTDSNTKIMITGASPAATGALVIPDTIVDPTYGELPVTAIDYRAFIMADITSLTLGSNLVSIGVEAFAGSGLTGNLIIPNSVTSIGDNAFNYCYGFNGTLTIGNSVTSIGKHAFEETGFTGNLVIPNSVTSIDDYAFAVCSGFTGSLIFNSETCPTLGADVFYETTGFTNLTVGATSTGAIGDWKSFSWFTGNLTIGNSVTSIGSVAFFNCTGFTGSLIIGNSVTNIGDGAFNNCSGFTGSLTIGNSVTSIGSVAFFNCTGFTGSLIIGNSVTNIGDVAFGICSGFTGSLTIGNSVTSIGSGVFAECGGFTGDLTIPNSVTNISDGAFNNCSGFTGNLVIPNSVTSIGDNAFYNCSSFTSVGFLGDAPTFGADAFLNTTPTCHYALEGATGFETAPLPVAFIPLIENQANEIQYGISYGLGNRLVGTRKSGINGSEILGMI